MAKHSAGILLYRKGKSGYEVLLVHPGGPFWAKKDWGAWSMPKGEFVEGEDPLSAAKREFKEETGLDAPQGDYTNLGESKQSSGKIVHAFILEAGLSLERFKSNTFTMEWPPKSGKRQEFPEADKAAWTMLKTAAKKLVKGQVVFVERLAGKLGVSVEGDETSETGQVSLF
jgi:predicted NUDIX family NTP pyrophosphohydrolase